MTTSLAFSPSLQGQFVDWDDLENFTTNPFYRGLGRAPHYNWGNALFAEGRFEEAIAHYREAARLDPGAAEAYNNWGQALAQQGRWDEAITRYREALRIRPDYRLAAANLDQALVRAGRAPAR